MLAWVDMSDAFLPAYSFSSCQKKKSYPSFSIHSSKMNVRPNCRTSLSLLRAATNADELCGIYTWSYAGGNFPVELRSGGNFYCRSYQAAAKWDLEGNLVKIDWKKFGKYELEVFENILQSYTI